MAGERDATEELRDRAARALREGRHDDALAALSAAARDHPGSALTHHDLGGVLKLLGRLDEAEISLRRAHVLAPDDPRTRHALGIVLMSQGRYAEGWPLYDARHAIPQLGLVKPALPFPEWRGEDVAGKRVLIFPEQGLGDQIQYARCAPWLAARGARVTLLCHPALARLFEQSLGVQVIAARGGVEFPDPDYWVMSGSVAGRTGLDPDDLPNAPYLRAGSSGGPVAGRIGVVARGNPAHTNDAHRSLPAAQAADLMALPGAVSLQPEDTGAKDMADTAALVADLDLVVTVDTAVAHLAGAMGKPVWILLPRVMTDWRWMEGRSDSPWYPSARLWRQPAPGDWASVLREVRAALV